MGGFISLEEAPSEELVEFTCFLGSPCMVHRRMKAYRILIDYGQAA